MAIKFSQFKEKVDSANIDGLVGYFGNQNIKISPSDLVGTTTLNASNITTGTLADARLSSNVALKDDDNNFSVGQTIGGDTIINGNINATSFIGSGASLTSLNADQLNGVDAVNYARTDIAETFNANVTIGAGAIISGNGSGLTNLDADTLDGVAAGAYAKTLDLSPVALSGDYNDLINTPPSIDSGDISNWNAAYNDKINSIAFNTGNGVVTFTQQDASVLTVDLDGRYRTSAQTLGFTSANGELSILDGNTISLDGRYMLIGGNISTLNNDSGYITSASLSPVATSGDYTDLINTPSNLAKTNVDNNFSAGQTIGGDTTINGILGIGQLKTQLFSGAVAAGNAGSTVVQRILAVTHSSAQANMTVKVTLHFGVNLGSAGTNASVQIIEGYLTVADSTTLFDSDWITLGASYISSNSPGGVIMSGTSVYISSTNSGQTILSFQATINGTQNPGNLYRWYAKAEYVEGGNAIISA